VPHYIFPGEVRADATLRIYAEHGWTKALQRLKGKRVWVELLDEAKERSRQQNKYLHWVIDRVRELWASPTRLRVGVLVPNDERKIVSHKAAHHALLSVFGPYEDTPIGKGRKSETQYTVEECSEVTEKIRAYALDDWETRIPAPDEWDGDAA
jgi:hypothetical protein